MREIIFCRGILVFACVLARTATVSADVGIIVYESKGSDTRLSSAGHIALITTRLCPAGTARLRRCSPDEEQGAVITHYPNIASGYHSSLFVIPIRDHFTATSVPEEVPVLSNGFSLQNMQIEYWRQHLQPSLPPLSMQQYETIRELQARFNPGRIFRRAVTMQYLFQLLGPRNKSVPPEPIAMIDPQTQQLIPDGRWRDAIGVQYLRSSTIILAHASPQQEERLLNYIEQSSDDFNALTNNCSDFVARSLAVVFGDAGFQMRPRMFDASNAWIASPISVASSFLAFARRHKVALNVKFMPMIAGTRRPSIPGSSISRGMLVPDARQGKLGIGIRVYFNTLNPLFALTSLGVYQSSRFADLQELVHQRDGQDLSRMANELALDPTLSPQYRLSIKREQVKAFGTPACCQAKQRQFARIENRAMELGILSRPERSLMLRQGQPFLLSRFYEQRSKAMGSGGMLTAGMRDCAALGCIDNLITSFLPRNLVQNRPVSDPSSGSVPDRSQVREMADSGDSSQEVVAFRLMTTVINYELSSEAPARGITGSFDADWQLYLDVAEANSLRVPQADPANESVQSCSSREFQKGSAKTDAYGDARSLKGRLVREGRELLYTPAR